MSPIGDSSEAWESDESTSAGLSKSVRAEIAAYFGGPPPKRLADDRDRGGYGRLIDDLERRIVEGLREPSEPPPKLGPFILEEKIGRGGFAVVYRATQERTGARAAVKIVPSADPGSHARVMAEVESLARIRHANIVRVIDTGEEEGFAWIATDYIDGMTLAEYIRVSRAGQEDFHIADTPREAGTPPRRKSTDPDAVRLAITWFRDLALALDSLHALGLVHRDVKPANILIDQEERPFLIDFGLSSSAESTVSGILAGTVPYMSPEQTLGGYLGLSPKSDIYSLAATIHEVLTGERVTRGVKREAILHQIAFVPVAPPSKVARHLPASLDPIFAKALEKDPNRRYGSAKELAEDLDRWLEERTLMHVDEPAIRRAGRVLRRHPFGTALASLAILAAIVWGAWALVARERAYDDVLQTVRSARERGDVLGALETLAAHAPRFGEREAFRQQYRETALVGGRALAEKLLRSQAFAAAGLASASDHTKLAREAEEHLERTQIEEPSLILVMALSKHLSKRPAESLAVLEAHPNAVAGSRALTELAAIAAIAGDDVAAYQAAVERLPSIPQRDIVTELCLGTWRQVYALRTAGFPKPDPAETAQLETDLGLVLRSQPDHALARSLLGMLKLERKDARGARGEFEQLWRKPASDADRAGTLLMHSAASMIVAGTASAEERASLLGTADTFAQQAIELSPILLDWLLVHLKTSAAWDVQAHWVTSALSLPWKSRPQFGALFLNFAAHALKTAPADANAETIVKVGEAIARQYASGLDAKMATDYASIQSERVAGLMRLGTEAWQRGDFAAARDLWQQGRACVRETRDRVPSIPYRMVASEALLASYPAENESDRAARQRLRSEAIPLLRIATDHDLLDAAYKGANGPEAEAEIRWYFEQCDDRLQRFEGEEEASSRGV